MRKILGLFILVAVVLVAGCSKKASGPECSFAETDFSKVTQIILNNGANGKETQITNADDIAAICKFLQSVTGANGSSGKGHYGFSYSLRMYDAVGEELFHITFAEGVLLYAYDPAEQYPTRYTLTNPTTEAVETFFLGYDSSAS